MLLILIFEFLIFDFISHFIIINLIYICNFYIKFYSLYQQYSSSITSFVVYSTFDIIQKFFRILVLQTFHLQKIFLYYFSIYFSDFGYFFINIILEFADLVFLNKDFFYLILAITFFALKQRVVIAILLYIFNSKLFYKQSSYYISSFYSYKNLNIC